MSMKSILFSIFLCCITLGCTFSPEQEQFLSSMGDTSLTRSNGDCSDSVFQPDFRRTDGSPSELTPDSISVLNWNIYKGQRQEWNADLRQLSQSKDIILLQEAQLNDKLQEILQGKNLYWNLNSAFRINGMETGVLVASTTPPIKSCGLRLSEPLIGVPKTILISSYAIAGSAEKLLVANIHGINISLGVGAYQEQLDSLQDVLKKHDGPIILAGDFNNWSEERTAIMMSLAENLALQTLSFDDDSRTTFFGDPVDQIMYRGLEPVTYSVHKVTSSDHNPISVTFRLVRTLNATEAKLL